jgi:uncharacterized coiled-coil DUF342 family protein
MTPPALTVTELLAILGVVGTVIGWVVKIHVDKRKDTASVDETTSRTKKNLAELVDELVEHRKDDRAEIDQLQERVNALENERDETMRKFNELKAWVRGLLKQLDAAGFQYDKPRAGLLDTGEHKAVK